MAAFDKKSNLNQTKVGGTNHKKVVPGRYNGDIQ